MKNKPLQPKDGDENARNATSTARPDVEALEYEKHEEQYNFDVLQNIKDAHSKREEPRKEFDGMNYSAWVERNYELDLAFVPPAESKNDVRLVNGITREKTNTAVSTVMGFNFDTSFVAFDQNDTILHGIGEASSDLVEKSNQIELWMDKRKDVYRALSWAGTYFTLETQEFPTKNYKTNVPLSSFGKINVKWTERIKKAEVLFRTLLLDPRMVIVGNPYEMDLDKQPFIAVARPMPVAEARSYFGAWDRWKYVPTKQGQTMRNEATDAFTEYESKYMISDDLAEGYVEVVYFMRSTSFGNELQIFCNGIAMLPVMDLGFDKKTERYKVSAFPLSSWSRSGMYPVVDWHCERITGFFYSKGIPAKTKFDQEIADFWITYLVRKARRSADPTLVNNSGVNITNNMMMPRTILTGIRDGSVKPLLPTEMIRGIDSSESGFYEMIKKEIDEKTTSREFSGITTNQYQSAKQFTSNQQAQMLQLAAITDGVTLGEKKRAFIRLQNGVIPYWYTKENKSKTQLSIGESIVNIYDSFSLDKKSSGKGYDKNINIADLSDIETMDDMRGLELDLLSEEKRNESERGTSTKRVLVDPDKFDFMRTLFYVHVKPRERENDAAKKADLDADIIKAINIFGQRVNMAKMEEKYAQVRNEMVDDWFGGEVTPEQEIASAMGSAGDQTVQQAMQPQGGQQQGGFNTASVAPPESIALS